MMRRRLIIAVLSAFSLLSLMTVASAGYDRLLSRDTHYRYLDEALLSLKAVKNNLNWQAPVRKLVRPFTAFDERTIGEALSEAWSAYSVAQETGETAILPDYFTGVALGRATLAAKQGFDNKTAMTLLQSVAQPEFFHLDGSMFQARVHSLSVRFAVNNKGLSLFDVSRDETITTLMNESSGWRVFSHKRIAASQVEQPRRAFPDLRLVGVNYYPAETPWRAFWREFDAKVIAADFDMITNLGGTAIRIFLPREPFLSTNASVHLENLAVLMGLAEARDLRVIPTLFDLKGGYPLASWSEDTVYLSNVLPVIANSGAVAFVDLKNEPDLDFENSGKAQVEAWLRAMTAVTREIAPNLALTVGWSAAEHALFIADQFDVITYHDYAPLAGTADRLAQVQAGAGDMPVMITEIGGSSWSALKDWPGSMNKQAADLATRIDALGAADGVFVWTLHDFPNPDPLAVGKEPWVRNMQGAFGLIGTNGKPKPAAKAVTDGFANFMKGKKND